MPPDYPAAFDSIIHTQDLDLIAAGYRVITPNQPPEQKIDDERDDEARDCFSLDATIEHPIADE